jgi:hypothetical protein
VEELGSSEESERKCNRTHTVCSVGIKEGRNPPVDGEMGQQVGGDHDPIETTASKMAMRMGTPGGVKPQQFAVKQKQDLPGFCDYGKYRTPFAS